MFKTYILYSSSANRYYIGHCQDTDARILRHNSGMVTATKPYRPWVLVYFEVFETKAEANRRELYIKRMKSRKYIESLIMKKGQ